MTARALELLRTTGPGFTSEPVIRFHTIFSFLDFFACGMFVAAFEGLGHPSRTLGRAAAWSLLAVGTSLFLLANHWCLLSGAGDWMLVNHFAFLWGFPPLLCLGLAMILLAVVRSEGFLTAALANPALVKIGKISYSVYLFHILVQLPMFKLVALERVHNYTLRTFCWGLISLGPTVLVAAVTYRLVEAPFLRLAERFRDRRPGRGPGSAALERSSRVDDPLVGSSPPAP